MSLIPLGILDFPTAAAGAYDLLETEILTGTQASVTFSSLNSTYGSDYQHLQVRLTGRSTTSGGASDLRVRFNADSGSNYAHHQLLGDGSVARCPTPGTSANHMRGGQIAGATAGTNVFSGQVIDILDPFETTKYTTIRASGGISGSVPYVHLISGLWMNTSALTSIELADNYGGSLAAFCRFSLYGLKGA